MEKRSNLLAPKQGVEYETGVRHRVARDRVHLLHTASIGHTGLTHVWVTNVVIGPICPAILVFRADVRGWRVIKVIIDYACYEL